jgi:hypothetical protein
MNPLQYQLGIFQNGLLAVNLEANDLRREKWKPTNKCGKSCKVVTRGNGFAHQETLKWRQPVENQRSKRVEERKFKRISLRFGLHTPDYQATGIQISGQGLFISTSHPIYPPRSKLVIEIFKPNGSHIVQAVVRHAKKMPRLVMSNERSGMGIQFISPSQELLDYLGSL